MVLRKLGLLAVCLALPASALNGDPAAARWAPPRETERAWRADSGSAAGIAPTPTPRPQLAAMELFKRDDYTLPSDYCGWYADYKSASYTCDLIGASCINVGSYRGCCKGTPSSCASDFPHTCIPSSNLVGTTTSCGTATICCSNSDYPACGTVLFSSSANPSETFTIVNCYQSGFDETLLMQDFPPPTATSTTTSTSASDSSSTHATQDPTGSSPADGPPRETSTARPKKSTPVGPIVGGVVGGVAVIGLVILGILYLYRTRPGASSSAAAAGGAGGVPPPTGQYPHDPAMQQLMSAGPDSHVQQPGGGPGFGSHMQQQASGPGYDSHMQQQAGGPGFDPRYSYVQGGYPAAPNQGVNPSFPGPITSYPSVSPGSSPDPSKMGSSVSPSVVHAAEVPARNPVGTGNNAAELA